MDASDLDHAIDSAYRAASGQTKFAADQRRQGAHTEHAHIALTAAEHQPVLVSYAYFQKDAIQKANAEFFSILVGIGFLGGGCWRHPVMAIAPCCDHVKSTYGPHRVWVWIQVFLHLSTLSLSWWSVVVNVSHARHY